ncbi:MAG: SGNH/GDSL hydrolase family protein [Pirellulales bacterium]
MSRATTVDSEPSGDDPPPARKATPSIRTRRFRTWLMRLGALAAGGMVSLALVEIVLRIYNPIHVPLRAHEIALPANQVFRYRVEGATKIDPIIVNEYNSLGMRGPEKPDDFDAATTVVTVGGSTTECVGLTDAHAWPAVLHKLLAAQHKDVWLNNAGMNGHSTFGHLVLMRQFLAKLHPDFALFLMGINDVGRGDLNEYDRRIDPAQASGLTPIIRHSELLCTAQVLWRTARAYDLGLAFNGEIDFANLDERVAPSDRMDDEITKHRRLFVPEYEQRVRTLVAECRTAGIQSVLLTQPAVYGDAIDPTTGRNLATMDVDGASGLLKWRTLELYNDVTRRVAAENHLLLIDVARAMPKDSRLYADYIHYSPAGAAKLAEIVARGLESELTARRTRQPATALIHGPGPLPNFARGS